MPPLKILISGSGIAASVLSRCLLHALPSTSITIVEKSPSLRLTGASVDLRSSAVDIIRIMNLESQIRAHTTKEAGISFVKGDKGALVGTLAATGRSDIQSITSEFEIFRGALANVFIEPILDKVNLIYDETVSHYNPHPNNTGVDVTFKNSGKTESYDLLIAADGLGSRIRGQMLNAKPRDHVHSEGVHVAYFTINKDLLGPSRLAKWYSTTSGRVIFLRPDPDPRGRTRANLMNATTAGSAMRARLDQALKDGNEAYMALMEEQFADAGWCAKEILEAMRESEDFYCSVFAQTRVPKLYDGRVALLGDAGNALPGFGTSLAVIGGYCLAGEILTSCGSTGRDKTPDIDAALLAYSNLLHPFVKSQQGSGVDQAMQYMNPQSQWGINVRNAIFAVVTGLKLDKLGIAVAAWFGVTEPKLDMPAYAWPGGDF